MNHIDPVVRYLILCEDVRFDGDQSRRASILGLISAIHSLEQPPYPLLYREICVFVQVAGCRGPADCRIEIRHADTDSLFFRTRTRSVPFPVDPLEIAGAVFRLRNLHFEAPGLFWVQFWYADRMIAQQPLLMR